MAHRPEEASRPCRDEAHVPLQGALATSVRKECAARIITAICGTVTL